ncbi:MAG: shikimate kinase [Bacteroidales bacterium]|nr:shikimate kinase [Porphyromonas sp.]MDD6934659.1 shikimate kinase [Bacteroidales bacterium]MDY3101577.1 shikimate kinase [Porphyromonas sp.]
MIEQDTPVFLVGYMASGKSTVGRKLARRMGREFLDTDIFIERRFRKSVADIFVSEGEEPFRRRETMVIEELSGYPNAVIATGGGLPCHHNNMDLMNQCGTTVYLKLPISNLVDRIELCKRTRPSVRELTGEALREHVTRAMALRAPIYEQAQYIIPCDEVYTLNDEERVAEQIATLLLT